MAQLQIPHFTFCLQNESARRSYLHQNCHQCVKSQRPLNYHQGECERCRRKDRHASATKRSSLGTANAKIIKKHPKPQNFGDLSVSFCLLVLFGNLDAEELRQTPSHCRAHGTRRGWRRRWQPQADGPQRC